ncbi:head-tail adaptor protein [Bradyrhizobium sp. USDA 4504]
MRAGNLDRVIEIQRRTTGLDLYGTAIDTWAKVATMRAQKLENATDNREGQRGDVTDTVITFRCRWLDGLSLDHRLLYDGQAFKITRLKELGRRRGVDIVCERVGA